MSSHHSAPSSRLPAAGQGTTPVVILGADALLAAQPATAVQVAHACLRAGYRTAVPGTWGDELVAHASLDALAARGPGPVIHCACPFVAERLHAPGADLSRFVLAFAPPPVATARYLRALTLGDDSPLHITYVGACPGADDPVIDARFTPEEFLLTLEERGIVPVEQPTVFEGILPPDRRRHLSIPGGVPAPDALWERGGGRRLVEITGGEDAAELAQHLLSGESLLVDLAPRVGCACSGAAGSSSARSARLVLSSLEPPRSPRPVVDTTVEVELATTLHALARAAPAAAAAGARHDPESPAAPAASPTQALPKTLLAASARGPAPPEPRPAVRTPPGGVRRRTPSSISRLSTAGPPLARDGAGRLLPRAYVARSRSLPRGAPVVPDVVDAPSERTRSDSPDSPPPGAVEQSPQQPRVQRDAPPVAAEYQHVVDSVARLVERHMPLPDAPAPRHPEEWRARLDAAIQFYRGQGYRTGLLERARALPGAPDVDALLRTFAGAVAQLRRLEELAKQSYPALRGEPVFRDPERLEAAEGFVDRLLLGPGAADEPRSE